MRRCFAIIITALLFHAAATSGQVSQKPVRHIANKIDSLRNGNDAEDFLRSIDKNWRRFRARSVKQAIAIVNYDSVSAVQWQVIIDSLAIPKDSMIKTDFDKDGRTDLLLIGTFSDIPVVACVIDTGKGFRVVPITNYEWNLVSFARLTDIDREPVLLFYYDAHPNYLGGDKWKSLLVDTLVYRFDDFVERNAAPRQYSIEKIVFSTSGCHSNCPVFSITIDSNRNTRLQADLYNSNHETGKGMTGTFRSRLTAANYNKILRVLDYINFPTLKSSYEVSWFDDQTVILKITYNNGLTKTIEDYGRAGTAGLQTVYALLYKLRDDQKWEPYRE